jgi:DNA-binding transcriptional regulator YbjK
MDTNIEEFIDTHESVPQHMREMMNVFNGLLGLESWSFVDYYHTLKPDVLDEQWCNERERSHVNFCVHGLIVHIQIQSYMVVIRQIVKMMKGLVSVTLNLS